MTFEAFDRLDGQVAVITGAMGGIGFATAQRLASQGVRIMGIVRRNLQDAQARLDQLPNNHLAHCAILADVTDYAQMRDAVKQVMSLAGKCNILVNTAGSTRRIPHYDLDQLTDEFFDEITKNNLRSYFTVVRAIVPLMKKSNDALIVNIGSVAGQNAGGGSNMAYGAAKAGIDSLTKHLSRALAPQIRVMGVSPGALATNFVPNTVPGYLDSIAKTTPLKRAPTVEDVAAAVEACVRLLRFTTGNIIVIDGGRTI
jgi:NAD(P)-dependent dehydrogenase (short-subunit alcohol dehydrogenase family)